MVSREQLAGAPSFVIIAAFKLRPAWENIGDSIRARSAVELARVLTESPQRVEASIYLSQGLKASADYFLRIHANDLADAQSYVNECAQTMIGRYSRIADIMIGTSKSRHYITHENSAQLNEQLNRSKYESATPRYAIVIPVKKTARWWNMSESERLHEMEVHTQKSIAYMRCVKRELYYSTGLDEQDFITYFETADLKAFHELNAALAGIRENEFQIRSGHSMLLGTALSIPEIVRILCQQSAS
jgi:chlorite dismutase